MKFYQIKSLKMISSFIIGNYFKIQSKPVKENPICKQQKNFIILNIN